MNTPSPLVPQGAFQDKGKSHVRITVFAILAIHVVLLGVLLIAGCNKKADVADNSVPPVIPPAQDQWPAGTPPPATPPTGTDVVPPVPLPVPTPPTATPDHLVPVPTPTIPPPPTDLTPPPVADTGAMTDHTIAKGETLATIGKKYGVGYKAIEAANPGINPTRLKIGEKIKIPAKSVASTAPPTASTSATGSTTYVVRSGDNLSKISKTTGVPVKQLRAANNLRTDQIRVGQKLKIPARQAPAPAEATAPPPVAPPITLPTGQ